MGLSAGIRLGSYDVLSALGAGGMGEVHRARDTKLGRDVAIKILPELFVADPERVARARSLVPIAAAARTYVMPRLSPDGTQVALEIRDQENDIWVHDLVHGTLTRQTFDPNSDTYPVWTPDGRRIVFGSARGGTTNVYRQPADNTGAVERLTTSPNPQNPNSIPPELTNGSSDVMVVHLDATRGKRVEPLIQTPAQDQNADISPDGRWLAISPTRRGQNQIYVRPFSNVNAGQWQVSTGGGTRPLWSRNGRELFYLDGDNLLTATPVQASSTTFNFGNPTRLLNTAYYAAIPGRTH